ETRAEAERTGNPLLRPQFARRHFRYISAPTGSGKTTSTLATAIVGLHDPYFTCAFVLPPIRQVDEVGRELQALVHPDVVKVWSSAHRHDLTDEERAEAEEEHGKLLAIGCDKKELISAPIVVVTHKLWEEEVQREQQGAVRYHTSHDPEGEEK